jgi:hypothetical protein
MDLVLFSLAIVITGGSSLLQTRWSAGRGSDDPLHTFLIQEIRANRRRLLVRIAAIINNASCGAYPLFLHWLLSFLPDRCLTWAAWLLNPGANVVQVGMAYWIAQRYLPSPVPGLICIFVALTPQFFHALSARVYGISARPMGVILFVPWLFCSARAGTPRDHMLSAALAVGIAYLIWGFSTFAQQAAIFFSVIFLVGFGHWWPLISVLAGVALLLLVAPAYAAGYLRSTFQFSKTYALALAGVYILKKRYSVWRDLVYDLWVKRDERLRKRLVYAYGSPVVIVLFMNPFALIAAYALLRGATNGWAITLAEEAAFASLVVFLATSFRITRFLGEPERYVEIVTVPSTIAGTWYLWSLGATGLWALIMAWFVLFNMLQMWVVHRRSKETADRPPLTEIREAIKAEFDGEEVRFSSNNEEVGKFLLPNRWQFARHCNIAEKYAGFSAADVYTEFPVLRKPVFEAAVREYRINVALLEKSAFADMFENNPEWHQRLRVLMDDEKYRLYRVEW